MRSIQFFMIVALVIGAAWLAQDYTKTKYENRALRDGQAQSGEIIRMLGQGVESARQRAATYRELYEELSDVEDDNSCRSPAIDHALGILRRQRRADQNSAGNP